jgi:hypothetical protein
MKGTDVKSLDLTFPQFRGKALAHLSGSVVGISKGDDFVGAGMAVANESSYALDENRRFAGTSAGHNQHGPMDMINCLLLLRVGENV